MLAHGDVEYEAHAAILAARLRRRLQIASAEPSTCNLRTLLVLAGQLEQALADAEDADPAHRELARQLTSAAAEAFHAAWAGTIDRTERAADVRSALSRASDPLSRLVVGDLMVQVRSPEGFELFAVFPEQYLQAARSWIAAHRDVRPGVVLVVGLRSIGVALAPLVAEALRSAGWRATSVHVRPTGPVWERTVSLGSLRAPAGGRLLVVDEGPGLSGSSMAAAAEAAFRAGFSSDDVALLPGHPGEPGPAATAETRAIWSRVRRFVVPSTDLLVDGVPLPFALSRGLTELTTDEVVQLEHAGGGLWRAHAMVDRSAWPAANLAFGRPRWIARTATGRRTLLLFGGLAGLDGFRSTGAEAMVATSRARSMRVPRALGIVHGHVAMPWIEGRSTVRRTADLLQISRLARHVADASGPLLEHAEQAESFRRLEAVLLHNAREALGAESAAAASILIERCRHALLGERPSRRAGDGRLGPDHWIVDAAGAVWKVGGLAYDRDGTLVARQPLVWDLAGAIVEWQLGPASQRMLLEDFAATGHEPPPAAVLHLTRAAYAAWRMGVVAASAAIAPDAMESGRQQRALAFYRDELARLLALPSALANAG